MRSLCAAAIVAALALFAGVSRADTARLAPAARDADVVIMGEVHDNPQHHANQAAWVKDLRPAALVFEMLTPEQALTAMRNRDQDADALGAALGWAESGWPDFSMYAPIFTAAPDAAIFGGAVSRNLVRAAMFDGAMAAMGGAGELFSLDHMLDPAEQTAREDGQRVAHCNALPEHLLPGMVEAQRLRDAALARAVLAAFAERGGPVAVITGNGHARRDWGVPAVLGHAAPELSILSIGQGEGDHAQDPDLYDRTVMAAPVDRGDPCDSLR